MRLIDERMEQEINSEIVRPIIDGRMPDGCEHMVPAVDAIHRNIPDNKRLSVGIYSVICALGESVYTQLNRSGALEGELAKETARYIFDEPRWSNDYKTVGVALMMMSVYGKERLEDAIPFFLRSAKSDNWIIREFAQGMFRKLISAHREEAQAFLLQQVRSDNPYLRRFVAETLRPSVENLWFFRQPEYALRIYRHLFQESDSYPRTSVGNALSDFSCKSGGKLKETMYPIITELARSGNPDSYWIAYRACRNLIKKEPLRVMDILNVDEYKYKTKIYLREDG